MDKINCRVTICPGNLENNKFISQVLEMSLNFKKSGNFLEILPVKNPLRTKRT